MTLSRTLGGCWATSTVPVEGGSLDPGDSVRAIHAACRRDSCRSGLHPGGRAGTGTGAGQPGSRRAPAKAPAAKIIMSQSPHATFDEGTIQRIAAAMLSYTALEVQGGWPVLPPSAKLAPGSKGPDVALLRQRLAITEDLRVRQGGGRRLRRSARRCGAPFPGPPRPRGDRQRRTADAGRAQRAGRQRLRQLAASLDRLAVMDFRFGQRYVVVNLPAAFAEAVDGDKVVRRYVVQVGRPDRPSPTLTDPDHHRQPQSDLDGAARHPEEGCHPQDAQGSGLRGAHAHARARRRRPRGRPARRRLEFRPRAQLHHPAGFGKLERARRRAHRHAQSAFRVHARHQSQGACSARTIGSSPRAAPGVEDPRALATWLLADNPGWGRREIDAGIAKGERMDIRLAHKVPVAWVYLTGWATGDGLIHFRDDVYGHDEKPALVADARPQVASAARASGFVLQSADTRPPDVRQVSYLDSQ